MARAIVAGLVASGIPGDDVTVMDRHPEKLAKLNEQFGVRMQTALGDWVSELDIVVLAVKPQGLKDFCLEAASHISAQTTVLSIAAAVPAEAIVGWLGTKRLVRAMPNTPAMVGKGFTGLFASNGADEEDCRRAEAVVRTVGAFEWVNRESDLHLVTAGPGSGPAYVFLFMEALADALEEEGLDPDKAKEFALSTVEGAAALARTSGEPFSVLRQNVTSKGGTTAKAIEAFEAHDLRGTVKAAVQAKNEGICHPILLGNDERIAKLAKELDLSLDGIEIVNLRHDRENDRRERYARILAEKRKRQGYTFQEANDKMFERNYFGMMMVETGDADAFITGLYTKYSNTIKVAKEVIGIQPEYKHFGTMHIINSKKGVLYLADTLINRLPNKDVLVDIARLSANTVRFFNDEPHIAMISYSNFGTDEFGNPAEVHAAVEEMQQRYPDLAIDGEMQVNFALNSRLRDAKYPFTRLKGKDVNTLVFPNLSSANSSYKLLQALNPGAEIIGPIQMGLNKPVHFTDFECSVRDVVNITAVAVIDAYVQKIMENLSK